MCCCVINPGVFDGVHAMRSDGCSEAIWGEH